MAPMSKMPPGYVKAKLAIEGGETIQVLFNPTEYTITKGNNWTFDPIKGNSLPKGKFGGGKPREMQVNLLLDKTLPNDGMSVKDITDKLFKMMEVKATSGAGAGDAVPPLVTFQWGEMIPFKAAVTSLTIAFQLFKPNGSPIRFTASATPSVKTAIRDPGANGTTCSTYAAERGLTPSGSPCSAGNDSQRSPVAIRGARWPALANVTTESIGSKTAQNAVTKCPVRAV